MRSLLSKAFAILLLSSTAAFAQARIDQLGAGGGVSGTDGVPTCQTCGAATSAVRTTASQWLSYIQTNIIIPLTTNVSGILPVANGGSGTASPALVAGTNVTITGSWPNQTINSTSGPSFASPTATAGPTAVNGVATTAMRSDAAPAIQKGSASQFGIIEVDGSTITATGGVITAIGGSATSIVPGTTTIGGSTAPCYIANSAGTTMACDALGTGVVTALGNAVNATGGFGTVGTSGSNVGLLSGTNTWSGPQTFGEVLGTITTQSGTTYTFATTDCGTTVRFTNVAAVTATIPATLPVGCSIAIEQTTSAGQVAVNGTAVSAATLESAHAYTKTFGQWAIISIFIESNPGTAVAVLTGDGA